MVLSEWWGEKREGRNHLEEACLVESKKGENRSRKFTAKTAGSISQRGKT